MHVDKIICAVVISSLAVVLASTPCAQAEQPSDLAEVEQQFRKLPMEARRLTGPLFWLHGDESAERLKMYLDKVAEGGNGCFTAESRPHIDWLGPGWYRDLKICLEAARRLNLHMWIFDEKWWPSGEVGGEVPQQCGSKSGRDIFFITNQHHDGPTKHFRLRAHAAGWTEREFDDASWSPVKEVAAYGGGAWGAFEDQSSKITLPPVTKPDPFLGHVAVSEQWLRDGRRVYLEAVDIPHEDAAAVAPNGHYAGGFIGKPFRLDVTDRLKAGKNTVEVVPFAPESVRLTVHSVEE